MLRGAIYTRISRDSAGVGAGVARQEEDCRAHAAAHSIEVVAIYSDNDVSAYSGSPRPGYRELLRAIEAGAVDRVVVWHTDRLYRRTSDLEQYITVCEPHKVATLSVQSGPLDLATPAGRMIARTLGSVAQYESEQKAERQKRANFQRAVQGRHFSTLRVFGYEREGLTLDPIEAPAVAGAYQAVIDGVPLAGICRRWNEQGLRTSKKQNLWDSTVLQQLLRSPRYAGIRIYHGEILMGEDGHPIRGEWPPIVDEDTWLAAQAVLRDPARRWPHAPQQLLSGVALCAICGAVMQSGGVRNGKRRIRCSGQAGHAYREAEPIDNFVVEVVLKYLSRPDIARAVTPLPSPGIGAEIRDEMARLQQRSDGLTNAFADGLISLQQLRDGQARIARRQKELEAKLPLPANSSLRRLANAAEPADIWAALDVEDQRAVIDELLTIEIVPSRTKEATYLDWRRRIINPDSVKLTWKL